jgi:hypothetical protein
MKYPASALLPQAVKDLALHCNKVNGFGGKEKEKAVRILLVLERHTEGGYRFADLEQMVVDAGWSPKYAAQLRELAGAVSMERSFRPPIHLSEADSERIALAYWQAAQASD